MINSGKQENEIRIVKKIIQSSEDEGEPLSVFSRSFPFSWSVSELSELANTLLSDYSNMVFGFTQMDDSKLSYVFSVAKGNYLIGPTRERVLSDLLDSIRKCFDTTKYNVNISQHENGFIVERSILPTEFNVKILDEITGTVFGYLRSNKLLPEEKDEADEYLDFDNF